MHLIMLCMSTYFEKRSIQYHPRLELQNQRDTAMIRSYFCLGQYTKVYQILYFALMKILYQGLKNM